MKPTPKKSIIKDPESFFKGDSTLFPNPEEKKNEPTTLLSEFQDDTVEINTNNDSRDNRTGTTDSSLTTVSSDTSETMLYKKYVKTWRRGERRLRRFSWEVYDDIPDDISSLSIKLSAELDERVSDSQLVRVLLEEGIKRLKKELNIN